jgi:succinate dehydrogenase flavin-adding protein (antitoxin of CptAB toxin-antitoxin module)
MAREVSDPPGASIDSPTLRVYTDAQTKVLERLSWLKVSAERTDLLLGSLFAHNHVDLLSDDECRELTELLAEMKQQEEEEDD